MARLYEFEVTRGIVEELVKDIGLSLSPKSKGTIVDNLMSILDKHTTFQQTLMEGRPGFLVRVGQVRTEGFTGEGLHMFTHSGSEGFLDTMEFDRRLKSSLGRQGITFLDKT